MKAIFEKVMEKFHCQAIDVFVQTYDYFEVRLTPDDLNNTFSACCKDVGGVRTLFTVPKGVMLYCVEVMTGHATMLEADSTIPPLETWTGEVRGEQ